MKTAKDNNKQGLIVFDMDGVIIDVSRSYRDTVRQTARLFFKGARAWDDLPNPLFSLSDLARVKQSGGLNNDWDLTFLVINLLFNLVEGSAVLEDKKNWSAYRKAINRCDVSELARFLKDNEWPVNRLLEAHGKKPHEFVVKLYAGDVGSGNVIKQIFQEIYLGRDLFESTYGIHTEVYHDAGYMEKERLLVDKTILKQFSEDNILAVATGRPRAEAEFALGHFEIKRYFPIVYTLDDCLKAEDRIFKEEGKTIRLSKPHPFMLDAIAASVADTSCRCYYIGDMPDDMIAAVKASAGFKGIGILISSRDKDRLRDELLRSGAYRVIENFKELQQLLQTENR